MRVAAQRLPPLESPVLNPTFFEGSMDVGGADGDLISGDALIDIKARMKPEVKADDLFQLLGYVLLDYEDMWAIRKVAVYLARQGRYLEWGLDELAGRAHAENDLARLRRSFRRFVGSERTYDDIELPRLMPARRPGGPVAYVSRPQLPTIASYRQARSEADTAWQTVSAAAAHYRMASNPGYLFWRRDPALRAERRWVADEAAEPLRSAVAAARALDAEVLRRQAAAWPPLPPAPPAVARPSILERRMSSVQPRELTRSVSR